DLSNISSADPAIRRTLVDEIRHACTNVGFSMHRVFFLVKNHGIPEEIIQETLAMMRKFFDLPLDAKLDIENTKTANFKGYSAVLSGNNDPNNAGDLQKGFGFGFEEIEPDKARTPEADGVMAGANVWPSELPEFRTAGLEYYHRALNLGKLLFPPFALALDLPSDFFDDKTKHSAALMRLLHYPPQEAATNDRVIGIGAHTESAVYAVNSYSLNSCHVSVPMLFQCFTILWQEPGIQALQVLNSSKEWVDAPATEGTLVINLGDEFARWTNIFRSTVHRAINSSGRWRYSIPLFFGTDYDVRLEPIPSCVSAERPARYEVVTAGEYVKSRLQATYGH
ncbi:Clavaminate synthase-like protein, partial [Mycena rebaudengoi]